MMIDLSQSTYKSKTFTDFQNIGIPIKSLLKLSDFELDPKDISKLTVSGSNELNPKPKLKDLTDFKVESNLKTDFYKDIKHDLYDSGILKQLIKGCINQGIDATILVNFVNEGDNVPESISLASLLNTGLNILPPDTNNWVPPTSWKWLQSGSAPQYLFY
ncbi:Proteasome assembly chaperone 2 [Smittium mucronatum]|uniref:Proteasome assembly chaperone 2 n=1 Tax=Smittium mucronatum TaxID=133383 RepID=A0A1R0GZE1_9FUNG|nr:Proteasome assembly chaperone 2 [Smittium mucronatum]